MHWAASLQGLPAWNILLLARKPFAVALHDCAAVPAVLSSANAKVRRKRVFSVHSAIPALRVPRTVQHIRKGFGFEKVTGNTKGSMLALPCVYRIFSTSRTFQAAMAMWCDVWRRVRQSP